MKLKLKRLFKWFFNTCDKHDFKKVGSTQKNFGSQSFRFITYKCRNCSKVMSNEE